MSFMQKLGNFRAAIKQQGGIMGSLSHLYRTDELKPGTLVGEDKFGNKYYENKAHMIGRSRWVTFSEIYGMDYDASHVPPEWHNWLAYMTDKTPTVRPPITRKWTIDHKENLTASEKEYVPYSTVKPKIEAWQPPKTQ